MIKVTSSPVKVYKSNDEYLSDMKVEETRPTRKTYGRVLDPGPYQEPLSIAIPPLSSSKNPYNDINFSIFRFNRGYSDTIKSGT